MRKASNIRYVGNFVLQHPEYADVIDTLLRSEPGKWLSVTDLKRDHGISEGRGTEDWGTWLSFSKKMKHMEFIDTKQTINPIKCWITVMQDKRAQLQHVLDWVKA